MVHAKRDNSVDNRRGGGGGNGGRRGNQMLAGAEVDLFVNIGVRQRSMASAASSQQPAVVSGR
jgi:hypothetical protein